MTERNLRDLSFGARHTGIAFAEGEGGTGTEGGGTGVPPAATWFAGADAETAGHIQNRGWDKLTPDKAALEAVKAHREAEKFVGAPANQLIRVPTDPKDEAGWKAVRQRLGAPAEATGYDFTGIKLPDGSALDGGFADTMKALAFERGLSKDDASAVVAGIVKVQASKDAEKAAVAGAALETARAELKANWGANFEANLFVAKQAAQALGVAPEAVAALESQIGYKAVMEMFQKIGSKIGEDKFVSNGNPNAPGVMNREQASARKAELMADKAWAARYLDGGAAEGREMKALLTMIVGDDTAESRGY